MKCYVCLAISLHYLNTKVEAHSIYPCLTMFFLFHLVLLKVIICTPWRNPCDRAVSQVIGGEREALIIRLLVKDNSCIYMDRKQSRDVENGFNSGVGSPVHWRVVLGKGCSMNTGLPNLHCTFQTPTKKSSPTCYRQNLSQKAIKIASHKSCDKHSIWKMLLKTLW